ncbi:MAG: sigma-70 family RNA polymerase sigma factor [Muribaculaceae bacterium]|nr:sigma-70 family RNA polymerase sigma factor [Muribaculaceae bacterium]
MQTMTKLTDEQLVAAYAKGENKAFDALLKRHQNRVFSYIYFVVKDRDLADDIFQETFVKAIMTIRQGRYTENGKFSAWITRIAHNLIIDHYRQLKAENPLSTDDEEVNVLNDIKLADSTVEDNIMAVELNKDVRTLIRELPASQRQVLVMRYYRNMSFKEIADATGVSINTALGRMRYAILNIRRMAKEKDIALTV